MPVLDASPVDRARMRVQVLMAAYTEAAGRVQTAFQALRGVALPFPDGQQNYRDALIAERAALDAYAEAERDLAALTQPHDPHIVNLHHSRKPEFFTPA